MAASYPAGFDSMSDPGANLSGPPLHSTMHNQINDVIEAIEAELGLNPSGADATVAAALAALSSRYVAVPTAWTALPLGTPSWSDLGGGNQVAQYRKVGDVVQVRGVVARPGGTDAVIGTLPAGFRPPAQLGFTAWTYDGATHSAGTFVVSAAGVISRLSGSVVNFGLAFQFSVTA